MLYVFGCSNRLDINHYSTKEAKLHLIKPIKRMELIGKAYIAHGFNGGKQMINKTRMDLSILGEYLTPMMQ